MTKAKFQVIARREELRGYLDARGRVIGQRMVTVSLLPQDDSEIAAKLLPGHRPWWGTGYLRVTCSPDAAERFRVGDVVVLDVDTYLNGSLT